MANIRTFKNIQDETLAWLNEAGDTDVTLTLVKQAIRAAHEKRLADERWAFKLSKPKTFSTVVGQQTYTLDPDFLRLMYVKNLTTKELLVEFSEGSALQTGYDWTTDTDSARKFALWGHAEVQNQPAAASVIAVTSSNTGDLTTTVTIKGDTATGIQTETIVVGASGQIQFTEILKVTKSDGWVGTMTLKSNANTVTNLTLGPTEYGKSYQNFYLFAIPSAIESLEYRFYRQPSPLVDNNDRPDYPSPFEELLVWEALCDMATYNTYAQPMVNYWQGKRDALLTAMQQTTNEAQSLNRTPSYTTYIDR